MWCCLQAPGFQSCLPHSCLPFLWTQYLRRQVAGDRWTLPQPTILFNINNQNYCNNKKHLKNVWPIRHCEPPHALILHCQVSLLSHATSASMTTTTTTTTMTMRDKRGQLWPHGMGAIIHIFVQRHWGRNFRGAVARECASESEKREESKPERKGMSLA